jgi:hypothetical protein
VCLETRTHGSEGGKSREGPTLRQVIMYDNVAKHHREYFLLTLLMCASEVIWM